MFAFTDPGTTVYANVKVYRSRAKHRENDDFVLATSNSPSIIDILRL